MFNKKIHILAAAALALLGCLSTTAACTTDASEAFAGGNQLSVSSPAPGGHPTSYTAGSAVGDDPTVCTSGYSKGGYSLDVSMYNGTDQTLTLDPDLTGHNGYDEHWATRPPATLAPGQCANMSAYTDNMADKLGLHAGYRMANGDFVPFSTDTYQGPNNSLVYSSQPSFDWSHFAWTGTQDDAYNIQGTWAGGYFHMHVTLKVQGGKTDIVPVTSPQIVVAAGATTPTRPAMCGLGYHVWLDASTTKPIVTVSSVTGNASELTLNTNPSIADGRFDQTTQYQGFTYSLHNASQDPVTATISWMCDPSVWDVNGVAPTFLQDSPPSTLQSQTPTNYRLATLGFPAATYGVKSGQLPPGLSLGINGELTGTPATPGTYDFVVAATNSVGSVSTDQLTVLVQ